MACLIISCGFRSVQLDYFRNKSKCKGLKLFESRHVSDVKEIVDGTDNIITGKVLPETKVHNPYYEGKIELKSDRTILKTHCTCKAGASRRGCKHTAAICTYINRENTVSKTDRPLVWNKPSGLQLEKYQKGCSVDSLIPQKLAIFNENYLVENVENISEEHMLLGCSFVKYLKSEQTTKEERVLRRQEYDLQVAEKRSLCEELYKFQCGTTYHTYECVPQTENCKVTFKRMKCPEHLSVSYERVQILKDNWIKIVVESESQSKCFQWYSERSKRITCSSRAHRVKTRKNNFEALALQFKREKFDGRMTAAMEYGLQTESEARAFFSAHTKLKVHTFGLIIKMAQPFLAGSPDGIIFDDKSLLEIKCPYICKNTVIVDRKSKISNVPYLFFNSDGNINLQQSHQYYTQIQTAMYVTGLKKCHFFVYSALDYVHLQIKRNETFLSEFIPKMEWFYFTCFLPLF